MPRATRAPSVEHPCGCPASPPNATVLQQHCLWFDRHVRMFDCAAPRPLQPDAWSTGAAHLPKPHHCHPIAGTVMATSTPGTPSGAHARAVAACSAAATSRARLVPAAVRLLLCALMNGGEEGCVHVCVCVCVRVFACALCQPLSLPAAGASTLWASTARSPSSLPRACTSGCRGPLGCVGCCALLHMAKRSCLRSA